MLETKKSGIRTFEDLECWKACRELRKLVSRLCKKLPKEETYRLKDQLVRAARSSTANIAEGYGRFHYQETMQFCRHARGSVYEILDHVIAGLDEDLFTHQDETLCRQRVEHSVKLVNGYIRYLQRQKRP